FVVYRAFTTLHTSVSRVGDGGPLTGLQRSGPGQRLAVDHRIGHRGTGGQGRAHVTVVVGVVEHSGQVVDDRRRSVLGVVALAVVGHGDGVGDHVADVHTPARGGGLVQHEMTDRVLSGAPGVVVGAVEQVGQHVVALV